MSCQGLVRIGLSVISISANGMIEHKSTINYSELWRGNMDGSSQKEK